MPEEALRSPFNEYALAERRINGWKHSRMQKRKEAVQRTSFMWKNKVVNRSADEEKERFHINEEREVNHQ